MPCAALVGCLLVLAACSSEDNRQRCDFSADCGVGTACVSGFCESVPCASNLECPNDAICYTPEGFCGEHECRVDPDCFSDRRNPFCRDGRCRPDPPPECGDRSDCGEAEICSQERTCIEAGRSIPCNDDEECGNPQLCDPEEGEAGACVDPCAEHADGDGFDDIRGCESSTGFCRSVECLSNSDCDQEGEPMECNDELVCVLQRFPCLELECNDPARPYQTEPLEGLCRCVQCLTDENCSEANGEICTGSKRCVFCTSTATTPSECGEGAPYFREGCCVECQTDEECGETWGLGSVCTNGRCVVCDCNDGCECPEGAGCVTQADDSGRCELGTGVIGEPCTQQIECTGSLACSYSSGECVAEGDGQFCQDGCPEPARCGLTEGGASLCYGCRDNTECPVGLECQIEPEWVGVYDGGRCLPL